MDLSKSCRFWSSSRCNTVPHMFTKYCIASSETESKSPYHFQQCMKMQDSIKVYDPYHYSCRNNISIIMLLHKIEQNICPYTQILGLYLLWPPSNTRMYLHQHILAILALEVLFHWGMMSALRQHCWVSPHQFQEKNERHKISCGYREVFYPFLHKL